MYEARRSFDGQGATPSTTVLTAGGVNVAQERNNNVFLRAIRPGMTLHLELDRCRPINAILVPSCQVLDDLRIDESMMTPAFLRAHCLRSLSKGKTSFITILGVKGDFTTDFNAVTVGARKLAILRRMPLDVQAGYAVAEELPDVYIVSDLACPLEEIRAEEMRTTLRQKSSVGVDDDAPPSSFKEFQVKLQDRRVKHVAKNIKAFLSQQSAADHAISPQAVRLFLDTTAEELLKADLWGPPQEADRLRDEVYEDLERYVMIKLADKCMAAVSENVVGDPLHARIGLLAPWVVPKQFCMPDSVVSSKFWRQAVAAMSKVPEFKVPRDKVVCFLNAITYLGQAARKVDADAGADVLHPAIILCLAHANPRGIADHLKYINQYRWREKLRGETQYYLTILQGAVAFWQSCTARELNIDPKDFEVALQGKLPPPGYHATAAVANGTAMKETPISSGAVASTNSLAVAPAAEGPAPPVNKRTVPIDRTAVIDDEEQRRRATWESTFTSRSQEVQSKWEVDTITQKSAEDEIQVSLAQIDRQLDAELQMLRSSAKAEEAVEASRLHGWHSALMQRESGLAQLHQHLVGTTKRVQEFAANQFRLVDERSAASRQHLEEQASENDRRARHDKASLQDLERRLAERAKRLTEDQRALELQSQNHRENAVKERQTIADFFDEQQSLLTKREEEFKAYVAKESESLSMKQKLIEKMQVDLAEQVKTTRAEIGQQWDGLRAAQDAHATAVASANSELDRREAAAAAAEARADAKIEAAQRDADARRNELDATHTTQQQLAAQRMAEWEDFDKKLQMRAQEVDKFSKASQEAHARRETELNRRTSELESSLEASRATIARRATDLTRHAQMNQEQLSVGMQEVNRLRAEVHQRMVDDRTTIAGIQSNLDERNAAVTKRETEIQQRMKEALDEAKGIELRAKAAQKAVAMECMTLCKEGVTRIDASDFLGQVAGYDHLKISDLQNLWKTMDALRVLKTEFQQKSDSLQQMAATLQTS